MLEKRRHLLSRRMRNILVIINVSTHYPPSISMFLLFELFKAIRYLLQCNDDVASVAWWASARLRRKCCGFDPHDGTKGLHDLQNICFGSGCGIYVWYMYLVEKLCTEVSTLLFNRGQWVQSGQWVKKPRPRSFEDYGSGSAWLSEGSRYYLSMFQINYYVFTLPLNLRWLGNHSCQKYYLYRILYFWCYLHCIQQNHYI